jgi:oligopeptide/dipeptide ABC transporter ATP-binding protein
MTAFSTLGLFPTPAAQVAGGQILFRGEDLTGLSPSALRLYRGARIGMVFQDPSSFLDPLMPVGRQVGETLREHGQHQGVEARVLELLGQMELPDPAGVARRYPHELSGGQRQRVLIAAALAMRPALLIADEPTTALDVTVQASILDLLARLRTSMGLSILLITHDLGIVAEVCDRAYVMYAGRVVESGPVEALFKAPGHPYTRALLAATPVPDPTRRHGNRPLGGEIPSPLNPPPGCRFHPRCPLAQEISRTTPLPMVALAGGLESACHFAEDVQALGPAGHPSPASE